MRMRFWCGIFVSVLAAVVMLADFHGLAAEGGRLTWREAVEQVRERVVDGRFVYARRDFEKKRGGDMFEVVFVDDQYVHEFHVAAHGEVVKYKRQPIFKPYRRVPDPEVLGDLWRARDIALKETGGGEVIEVEEEMDKGHRVAEVEIIHNGEMHEVEVDLNNGMVLKYRIKRMDGIHSTL